MPDKVNGQEVKDSIVLLGDKKQDKQMENVLRILETPDRENPGSTVRIITNDFEHSAALISFVLLTLLKREANTDELI